MIVRPDFVAALYNHAFPSLSSTVDIGGTVVRASGPYGRHNVPYALFRYTSREAIANGDAPLWQLRFEVNTSYRVDRNESIIFYLTWPTKVAYELKKAKVTVSKVKGDLKMFEKDMVILKLYQDEWFGVPVGC